jgi:hypothetical protein
MLTRSHALLAPADDVLTALQLALTLEYLQAELYARAVAATGLIPPADLPVFTKLRDQENEHVTMLRGLITARGATPSAKPSFDFTAKGNARDSTGASFNFLPTTAQYAVFSTLAHALEDLGVRAYKGQTAALVSDKAALTTALTIHSVEARHASQGRRMRDKKGWITLASRDDLPAFLQPVYDGEDNTTQAGLSLAATPTSSGGSAAATEAFDEPLTRDQVLAILRLFLA